MASRRCFGLMTCASIEGSKVLLANHATDPVVSARFEREVRALAAINHPNVVAIHDVASGGRDVGSEAYMVMALCPDGSLADLLDASQTGSLGARAGSKIIAAEQPGRRCHALRSRRALSKSVSNAGSGLPAGRRSCSMTDCHDSRGPGGHDQPHEELRGDRHARPVAPQSKELMND